MPEPLAGLIVDYGGVLTSALQDTMTAWAEADDIEMDEFSSAMKEWLGDVVGRRGPQPNPVHALERGEIEVPHFEEQLAARLRTRDGRPVEAEGLLDRMFAGFETQPVMFEALRRARAAGIKTALLSNSWGKDYPREGWDELFDAVVISGEVGMRKPEPGIFLKAAEALGPAARALRHGRRPHPEREGSHRGRHGGRPPRRPEADRCRTGSDVRPATSLEVAA